MGMQNAPALTNPAVCALLEKRGCAPHAVPAEGAGKPDAAQLWVQGSRYSDRPITQTARLVGVAATGAVCLAILLILLVRWGDAPATVAPADLSMFEISEPAAPPAPASEIPPGPEQMEREQSTVEAPALPVPVPSLPSLSAQTTPAQPSVSDPGPPVERTTAPEARPAPPAATPSDARPSWEGRVLAALNKAKRYPREASRNRQQGTPWIRFIMDRGGKVRSVRLERSSGFDALDREALALAKRAEPLPSPPDSVAGHRIELVVPIEFFMA